jgi:hypothetical protein
VATRKVPYAAGDEKWKRSFAPTIKSAKAAAQKNGIPSHDTMGRLFRLLDRRAVE